MATFSKENDHDGGKALDLTLDDEQLKQLKMLILESRHEGTRIFIKTRMRLVTSPLQRETLGTSYIVANFWSV